ncbi:MAG: hypothetical protein LQ352_000026 [Teloschistes flavicans]|nr:MAG: hypothetical protein LQ352_000026 [Teloschistes flavicans]
MAGASDKARFYMEQSVPEFQQFLRKKIFTKDEVSSIVKKRSAFEHKLNARGSKASDYARYAGYEMNLESLRRTRAKRLGAKSSSYTGQRRILAILDRATRKFHGDTALWLQYLTYARKQKSNKRVSRIMSDMLRLHPVSPDLWIYAANYTMDERADVTEARAYMQRGLRFCRHSKQLWDAYLRLEMIYISKLSVQRQILGLDPTSPKKDRVLIDEDMTEERFTLPLTTSEGRKQDRPTTDFAGQVSPSDGIVSTPAIAGAIPIAVFDAAMKEFPSDAAFGARLYDSVTTFHGLPCIRKILHHVVEALMTAMPTNAASLCCFVTEPIQGISAASLEFPGALMNMLDRLEISKGKLNSLQEPIEQTRARGIVARHAINRIIAYFEAPGLDPDIRAVLDTMLQTLWRHSLSSIESEAEGTSGETVALLQMLTTRGFSDMIRPGVASALQRWPEEPQLLAFEVACSHG